VSLTSAAVLDGGGGWWWLVVACGGVGLWRFVLLLLLLIMLLLLLRRCRLLLILLLPLPLPFGLLLVVVVLVARMVVVVCVAVGSVAVCASALAGLAALAALPLTFDRPPRLFLRCARARVQIGGWLWTRTSEKKTERFWRIRHAGDWDALLMPSTVRHDTTPTRQQHSCARKNVDECVAYLVM
jgi:hypothetical protein